jgi:hypothetical protein
MVCIIRSGQHRVAPAVMLKARSGRMLKGAGRIVYTADCEGIVGPVAANDVEALLAAGCKPLAPAGRKRLPLKQRYNRKR